MYRVLIAEDEILVRVGLRNSIDWAKLGMEVIAAVADGAEAWDVYVKEKPDIIITDIKMPIMDGMKLIQQIREKDEHTKIVILTALEEFDLVRQAISLGVTDYMLKLTMTPDQMENVLLKVKEKMVEQQRRTSAIPPLNEQVWLENLIKDFMFRQLYSTPEFTELLKQTNKQLPDQKLLMMVVDVDHFHVLQKRFNDENGDLIKSSLLNVLNEVLMMYNRGLVIHIEPWRYMLLLSMHDLHSELKIQQLIAEMAGHIQKVMNTFFNVTVTFGVSPMRNGFQHIPKQYAECLEALAYKFVLGGDRLIHKAEVRIDAVNDLVESKLDKLTKHSALFGDEKFQKQWDSKIKAYLQRDNPHDRNALNALMTQLLQLPVVYFALTGSEADQIAFAAHEKLASSESLEEAVSAIIDAMDRLASRIKSRQTFSKAVADAIEIIHLHYNEELSSSDLAAQVSMSTNYFGTLFRKETGLSVVDYTNSYRIAKSMELMNTTMMKTYEIAHLVGFSDHSYFSRVFRKETGLNPTEYRKRRDSVLAQGNRP
ncbi:response regulator [Cohnella silvisoli]|uniref:Response regulator n=1 Tax=Cohnella silvisoli TaxID=2873699 RepID=A0ABV1KSZ1_9BACL|nr:response regulator [Cohnella silvisoli]MCD9021733.1 response regulator [Cohnella silvisoli]